MLTWHCCRDRRDFVWCVCCLSQGVLFSEGIGVSVPLSASTSPYFCWSAQRFKDTLLLIYSLPSGCIVIWPLQKESPLSSNIHIIIFISIATKCTKFIQNVSNPLAAVPAESAAPTCIWWRAYKELHHILHMQRPTRVFLFLCYLHQWLILDIN